MEQIGYSLIDSQGNELQGFGDTAGQAQGVPDVVRLPNGDDVHCPEVGADYDGLRLVERWLQYGDVASVVFDGAKVLVTRPAPTPPTIEQKLESVGLSVEDLKTALGI
jgi:hypothetical protein